MLMSQLANRQQKRVIRYFQSGDGFRTLKKSHTFAADRVRSIMDKGHLLPEFLPVMMWGAFLVNEVAKDDHLIIDGSPRTLGEAKLLDGGLELLERKNTPIVVVYLNVSAETSEKRMHNRALINARADDNPDAIAHRLSWFEKEVVPVIEFYRAHPDYHLVEINGDQEVHRVFRSLVQGIGISK
jgi:adenylate kinase